MQTAKQYLLVCYLDAVTPAPIVAFIFQPFEFALNCQQVVEQQFVIQCAAVSHGINRVERVRNILIIEGANNVQKAVHLGQYI